MHYARRAVLAALVGIGLGHLTGPIAGWAQDPAKPRPEARKVEPRTGETGKATGRDGRRRAETGGTGGGREGGVRRDPAQGRSGGGLRPAPANKPDGPGKPRPELRRRKP